MRKAGAEVFTAPEMAAIFAPEEHLRQMLAFAAVLARAEARLGIIPAPAADAIAAACQPELFDVAALARAAALADTPTTPIARMLSARLAADARPYVYWAASDQDVIDTALMLQMRAGLDLLDAELLAICDGCAELARRHRRTLMPGRTQLQQVLPTSFGLEAARWLALATRQLRALRTCRAQSLALQCGGAAGTLGTLGADGLALAELLAEALDLPLPELPWHAERDRIATVIAALAVAAGALATIAEDIVALVQARQAVATVDPRTDGPATPPGQRRPRHAGKALAAAMLALRGMPIVLGVLTPGPQHEVANWAAECSAVAEMFRFTSSVALNVGDAIAELQIDVARMQADLDQRDGLPPVDRLTAALAARVGRPKARRLVKAIAGRVQAAGGNFRQALLAETQIRAILPAEAIEEALDPVAYLGSADRFIDRALESYEAIQRGTMADHLC